MNIREAYRVMQEASGFEVGDTVQMLRSFKSREMGCDIAWHDHYLKYIGAVGTVVDIDGSSICVRFPDVSWFFPFFVYGLLKKSEPETFEYKGKQYLASDVDTRFAELKPVK